MTTTTPSPATGQTVPAAPPRSRPAWHQHLEGLPTIRRRSIAAQTADPAVRAAVADAYRAGGTIGRISARTVYSRRVVQHILIREDVPRPRGGLRRAPDVPDGYDNWTDYTLTALRSRITDGIYPRGSVLPPPVQLAADLGTRLWAVKQVIPRLVAEKLLLSVRPRGTVVTGPQTETVRNGLFIGVTVDGRTEHWPLPGTHRARAEAVRWTLIARIADDAAGRLPSQKTLAHQLPESVHVVRTAVGLLAGEGLLTTRGSYGTWTTPGSRETARILLATRTTPAGSPGGPPPRPVVSTSPTGPPMLINSAVPSSARVWNYWGGGKDHYEIDRAAADDFQRTAPQIKEMVREARAFRIRAVTHLIELGISQFLDIGPGLPTPDSTHAVAQSIAPHARIVYADHDPHVTTHLRALCPSTPEGSIACIDADLRTPETILTTARTVLDFGRPVALLLLGVLGHIPDTPQATAIVRRLTGALPPGSFLVHHDAVDTSPDLVRAQHDHNATGTPYALRSPVQLALFYEDLQPLDPGIGPVSLWRPGPGTRPKPTDIHGGIARLP
ncbi:SAM-dependent methyltransferase [Streptomyces sp. 4F14]|uniref:SAM-dependent methyltransferase n=1 Tax=Streptomyces sp. 4F14 TaxID=3394380 RepID=UPI003A84B543